ncbi:MAG TPA: hypothetical protein VLK84_09020 [Longimicrobium sp.]|nr:hypothetical protein [Longimicrobium sp.]
MDAILIDPPGQDRRMRAILSSLLIAAALAGCAAPAPAPPAPPAPAAAPDVFAAMAGRWTGVLEYADYRSDRRVQLPTRLVASVDGTGRMLTLAYAYTEPSGKEVTSDAVHRFEPADGRYLMGDDTFAVALVEGFGAGAGGRMVLTGTVLDNDRQEPARHTITLAGDTLRILKETRTPWTFRNEYRLTRVAP